MKEKQDDVWYVGRRGELLAQQFLLGLGARAAFSLATADVGLDYVVFFETSDGSPRAIAVEVKATERDIKHGRFPFRLQSLLRLQRANIPVLILLADVKRNEVYFTWAKDAPLLEKASGSHGATTCTISLTKASAEENDRLQKEIVR